jgi:hypothetical protein
MISIKKQYLPKNYTNSLKPVEVAIKLSINPSAAAVIFSFAKPLKQRIEVLNKLLM